MGNEPVRAWPLALGAPPRKGMATTVMHFYVYSLIRLVHILSMAFWLASGLWVAGDMRRTLALGKPHTELMVARIERSKHITIASALLTLASGLGIVFAQGGFSAMPVRIHLGIGLTFCIFTVGAALVEPIWQRIKKIVESDGDASEALRLARRFSLFYGVEHALKLVILFLMVVKL